MATLTGQSIDSSYQGLIKTIDNGQADPTVLKQLSDGVGGSLPISVSQVETKFQSGSLVDFTGATVNGLPSGGGFEPTQLSGASQSLDLGQFNFFDGGALTDNTTLTFTNVPTETRFQYSYTVGSAPYNLNGASDGEFLSVTVDPSSIALSGFKADGTIMYLLREGTSGDRLYQWNLSTAWDITTGTYSNNNLLVETQDNQVGPGMYFKQDGLSFWLVGAQNDSVYEYTMTTAGDLSTATYSGNSFSIALQEATPKAVTFKPDGLKFWVIGNNDRVYAYTMTTAWDITTASYDSVNFNAFTQDNDIQGLAFNNDGTKFFLGGGQNTSLFEYGLTTAWDITTASYSGYSIDLSVSVSTLRGLAIKSDGTEFYTASRLGNQGVYSVNSGATQVILPASVQNAPPLEFSVGDVVTYTFYTLDSGTNVYYEEQPEADVASAPGLIAGTGTDAIAVSSAVVSTPSVASGTGAIAIGNNAAAGQTNNISIGTNNNVNQANTIVIGDNNDASSASAQSVLIRPGGGTALAFRSDSVTIGHDTYPGQNGVCIGTGATGLQNDQNIQIGHDAQSNSDAVAIGDQADARGADAVAIGAGSSANATAAIALGPVSATTNNTVTIQKLQMVDYATLNYADDTAAAAGGIPLGGVYHTSGALKIRIA